MKIFLCCSDETSLFAAQELSRLVSEMGNSTPEIISGATYDESADGIFLGTFDSFAHLKANNEKPSRFDDEIQIEVEAGKGIIAGICPRSILIAVYRYAKELGCRFLTVGKAGEKIPSVDISSSKSVSVHETPYYRHRGVCIEGSVSIENVKEMLDFLPKVGMNSYFFQFRESHAFFDRWYSHLFNPLKENAGSFSIEDAQNAVAKCAVEMTKRGILYHAVGHGWTTEPFGVPGLGWDKWEAPLPEEAKEAFALLNGKRDLFEGVPINTQACMSNPTVRRKIIENICKYIQEHPTVDALHFWLGDGNSNHCECENCVKHRPSDFYIMILNELDALMKERNLEANIVFLIYLDLLWPPVEFKLNNPDRFIIMFAPITRSYRSPFRADGALPPITDYVRNPGFDAMPFDPKLNVSYLKSWQENFKGSGFDFDYHYMWAHIKDPGCIKLAKIVHEDIKYLENIGLDGFISCQLSRVMFPNALNFAVMGGTLWDVNVDFDTLCKEYFKDCYGENAEAVYEYMNTLSELYFSLELEGNMRKMHLFKDTDVKLATCDKVLNLIDEFVKKFSHLAKDDIFFSWLMDHAWIYREYTILLIHQIKNERETVMDLYKKLIYKIFENEEKYQSVFDPFEFTKTGNADFVY